MAKYEFGAVGKINGENTKILFVFDDDKLIRCTDNDRDIPVEMAFNIYYLGVNNAPGYVPCPKQHSIRWNALSSLQWRLFDKTPETIGDTGEFEFPEEKRNGEIY